MNENLKPHIFKFDNVKVLTITLVIIGSFAEEFTARSDMFQSLFVFVYSFHAPLFIFLSGLFQKQYKDGAKLNTQRISCYLVLGFILKLMIYFLRIFKGDDNGLDMLGGASMEWYLFVLSMYMVTMYLLRRVNRYVMLSISIVLGVVAGFLPLGDTLYLMRYFVFLPFYVAGYYLTPMQVRRFSHRLNVKLAGIAFMFIYFVLCFRQRELLYPFRMLFTGRNPYSIIPIEGCTFYHRLLCYGISAVLIISVMAIIPNVKVPVLTSMGKNIAGAYFWHYPIVLILWRYGVMDLFIPLGDPLWKFLVLASAVLLTAILLIPIFTWPLRKLDELFSKIPTPACLIGDAVLLAGALVVNIFVP